MMNLLRGCYLIGLTLFTAGAWASEVNQVNISSRIDPNAITITEVDIVFIYDESLLKDFPESKSRWYSMRRTLTQRWGEAMDIVSVFIPQGFDSETASLPQRRSEAAKVFVIAQHDDSKAKPIDITQMKNVSIIIDGFGIIVTEID